MKVNRIHAQIAESTSLHVVYIDGKNNLRQIPAAAVVGVYTWEASLPDLQDDVDATLDEIKAE